MSSQIEIIRFYRTKTGRMGMVYSIDGRKAATFTPAGLHRTTDTAKLAWLYNSLGIEQQLTVEQCVNAVVGKDFRVKVWKERVAYITLLKSKNGRRGRTGGQWSVNLLTGETRQEACWSGAATRRTYEDLVEETLDAIASAMAPAVKAVA